jgi:hypothetical protein
MSSNQQQRPRDADRQLNESRERWEQAERLAERREEVQRIRAELDALHKQCDARDKDKKQNSLWSMFHKR